MSDHKINKYIYKVIPTMHENSKNPPSLEEMVQDFEWPFEIPVLLRGEEPYAARYSIQGRFSTPQIEIKGLYPCCHAKRGEPHRCKQPKPPGAGKAGSKWKAVTPAKAVTLPPRSVSSTPLVYATSKMTARGTKARQRVQGSHARCRKRTRTHLSVSD